MDRRHNLSSPQIKMKGFEDDEERITKHFTD